MDILEIQNTKYELVINSPHGGLKEVLITFQYKNKKYKYSVFFKEGENIDYIAKAKERFEIDVKSGKIKEVISKNSNRSKKLSIGACVFCALAVVFASLFTWKMLTSNSGGGGDTPVVDEVTTTLTYSYSPYRKEEGSNKLTISFEPLEETLYPEDPPFVGDVYIQWNKDDPSTKEKIEPGTKKIEFDYASKYSESSPREFTAVLSGDVRTFVANAEDFFGNTFITSINFGNSIRRMYQASFYGIEDLNYVRIGGQVRIIEASSFCNCINLTKVDFSTTDETDRLDIAHAAFMGCNKLRTINFPKRLTYLGPLKECRTLEQITIPKENEYFTTTYSDENNQIKESGILVTKKEVTSPFEFDPEVGYEDPNFSKDTVVAATTNASFYEGIKSIYSLSGADIFDLRIPKSVESIYAHEVCISRIDYIHVARGNKHFTDLYQSEDNDETANVLAELNDQNELTIIRVTNNSTPIKETGRIFIDGEAHDFPVTAFGYSAANNTTITSLDLPATLKTFCFDNYVDEGYLDFKRINPFSTTLTDLTIRAMTPPTYVPSPIATNHINDVFGERIDKVSIHVPEEAIKNYSYYLDPNEPEPAPGYWNLSDKFDIDPENIRFSYNTLDSKGLFNRKEALDWVKTNYTQHNSMEFTTINRWDFTPLIDAQTKSIPFYDCLKKKLEDINFNSYDVLRVIGFSPRIGASCNPNGMGDFRNVAITPLNANNFDLFFKTFTPDTGVQEDFTFSIKNGCLEAIQCPNLDRYFGNGNIIDGQVVHTMKFNKLGYLVLSRLEFKNLTYLISNNEKIKLDDIYYSIENYGAAVDGSGAGNWVDEHTREPKSENIYSRTLDWSFIVGVSDFNYNKIENKAEFERITDYIRSLCLNCTESELPIDNLYCEKDKECIYDTPLKTEQITRSYVESLGQNGILGISEDENRLTVLERYKLEDISSGTMMGMGVKVQHYNEFGICDKEGFYLFDARISGSPNNFSGYLESTNIFTE